MKVLIDDLEYELINDEQNIFNEVEFKDKCTDYFKEYDYIVGDYAYNKLRLKGFNDEKNKKVNPINNYKFLNKYLEEQCAYGCKHFILKKLCNIVNK